MLLSDVQKPPKPLKDNDFSFVVDLNRVLVVDLSVRNGVEGFQTVPIEHQCDLAILWYGHLLLESGSKVAECGILLVVLAIMQYLPEA